MHEDKLSSFIDAFGKMEGPKILVHGGGPYASQLGERLGVPVKVVDGRRLTDIHTLEVVSLAYAALNKRLVATLQAAGVSALGLSGADMAIISASKRQHPTIDYGFVGDIDEVDILPLQTLLKQGVVPVICSLTCDESGQLLNTNADTIASSVASSIEADELVLCFDLPGVLTDTADPASSIPSLELDRIDELAQNGIVGGGMLPKLHNARTALEKGVKTVRITDFLNLDGGTKLVL